jgi:vacuolar protein sorting-associated protein 13B
MPVPESAPQMPSPVEKTQAFKTEQSSDDLRTGIFQYVQDAGKYKQHEHTVPVPSCTLK